MSEYQYYEFKAVDRPLTRDQIDELRALSSRADITSTSFQNTYNYGDFRGNPDDLMEEYFDAHVYVSNFGIYSFMLRLPRTVLPADDLTPYGAEDILTWKTTEQHTIIEWRLEHEPSGDRVDGEGWMDRLLPIRDELARGDYRSLYIGWLRAVQIGIWEDEDESEEAEEEIEAEEMDDGIPARGPIEPVVPRGLRHLTAAQAALAEFLEVDTDLIEAAAAASAELSSKAASPESIDQWVGRLPGEEIRAAMTRIIQGEGLAVQTELQSQYHRLTVGSAAKISDKERRRTAGELLALADKIADKRKQRERGTRDRKERERLAALVKRFPSLWTAVDAAAKKKNASGYDEACKMLVDLRDAYAQAGRSPEFEQAFAIFCSKYSGRPALKDRLLKAGLVKDELLKES